MLEWGGYVFQVPASFHRSGGLLEAVLDRPLLAPSIDRPQCGDTFKIRLNPAELPSHVLFTTASECGDLFLDVYNPADPPVCYVEGDADRWCLSVLSWAMQDGLLVVQARWANQQFTGLTIVEIRIDFAGYNLPDLAEGELEFL
ncbi:MAG: hypothetical protein NUV56_03980 [Candidatus Uhrbacteria bacterium]|nr:hypothetical protein [Candidatus Uhrbacteria bacterium]